MPVSVIVDGVPHTAREGETVAGLLLREGLVPFRRHPVDGSPRTAFCLMGVCFECLVTIDGRQSCQACLTAVADGMIIERGLE